MEIKVNGVMTEETLSLLNQLGSAGELLVVMDIGDLEPSVEDDQIGFAKGFVFAAQEEGVVDNGMVNAEMDLLHPFRYFPEQSFVVGEYEGKPAIVQKDLSFKPKQ